MTPCKSQKAEGSPLQALAMEQAVGSGSPPVAPSRLTKDLVKVLDNWPPSCSGKKMMSPDHAALNIKITSLMV